MFGNFVKIKRWRWFSEKNKDDSSKDKTILSLEPLFIQKRKKYYEDNTICIKSRSNLLKFRRISLKIVNYKKKSNV